MASMIRVRFRHDMRNLDRLERNLDRRLEGSVKALAEAIVEDIRSRWSPVPPSVPGTPPAVRTGDLDASMETAPTRDLFGRFGKGYRIIFNDPATAALEFGYPPNNLAPRPFIVPAFIRFGFEVEEYFDDLFDFI